MKSAKIAENSGNLSILAITKNIRWCNSILIKLRNLNLTDFIERFFYADKMKQFIFVIWGCLIYSELLAQSNLGLHGIALKNSGVSAYVIEAESGSVVYATPQVSLAPASVMKVVTSAAALEILGPDYRFHTQIGFSGAVNGDTGELEGNLVLRGGCDPAFYSEYFADHYKGTFEEWCKALKQAGIKKIQGDLLVDLSKMDGGSVPGGWQWDDLGNYYGAGVSALTFSDNYYKIHCSSPAEAGKRVSITSTEPQMDSLQLTNNIISSEVNRDLANVIGAPGSFFQEVEGTIPAGRSDFIVKASMPNPAGIAAIEFCNVLKNNGISILGRVFCTNKWVGNGFTLISDKSSPPLKELIVPLNHESLNLYAEHLLREIGRAKKDSSELDKSLVALKEFWKEKNLFLDGFYPTDGSGLSRSNGICTQTLAEILRYMYLGPNHDVFFNSLPSAGINGTLQNAFKGTKLENNLRAKTGSMTRVRSLAGIFTDKNGKKLIFALIINNFEGKQATVEKAIEAFLNEIYSCEVEVLKR